MTDPKRLRENIERNKETAKKKPAPKQRGFLRWVLTSIVLITGAVLLLPGKLNIFFEDSLILKQKLVSIWLRPERWEGLFSSQAEGYANHKQMQLSRELDVYLLLKFERDYLDFDGELISSSYCASGSPFANVLVRGYPNILSPNRLRLEVYEIFDGEIIELGSINAELNQPVVELRGWTFRKKATFAREHQVSRDDLPTLCVDHAG